jgi:hypothetical protein
VVDEMRHGTINAVNAATNNADARTDATQCSHSQTNVGTVDAINTTTNNADAGTNNAIKAVTKDTNALPRINILYVIPTIIHRFNMLPIRCDFKFLRRQKDS